MKRFFKGTPRSFAVAYPILILRGRAGPCAVGCCAAAAALKASPSSEARLWRCLRFTFVGLQASLLSLLARHRPHVRPAEQ